jgi:hypothetical protein
MLSVVVVALLMMVRVGGSIVVVGFAVGFCVASILLSLGGF